MYFTGYVTPCPGKEGREGGGWYSSSSSPLFTHGNKHLEALEIS